MIGQEEREVVHLANGWNPVSSLAPNPMKEIPPLKVIPLLCPWQSTSYISQRHFESPSAQRRKQPRNCFSNIKIILVKTEHIMRYRLQSPAVHQQDHLLRFLPILNAARRLTETAIWRRPIPHNGSGPLKRLPSDRQNVTELEFL